MTADTRVASAVVTDGDGSLDRVDVRFEPPGPGEVLVEMTATGICRTDLDSMCWGTPMILGHEGAGVVGEVGTDVTSVEVGDHVVLNWARQCDECRSCRAGRPSRCERRRGAHATPTVLESDAPIEASFGIGTMAAITVVPDSAVTVVDRAIDPSLLCGLGCAGLTGYGAIVHTAGVEPGDSVAVVGAGSVGLHAIRAAAIAGAAPIIAIDVDADRLRLARAVGATDVVEATGREGDTSGSSPVADVVRSQCGERGVDVAIECTGTVELALYPLALVRNGGTAIQLSGHERSATVDLELFEWDKTYINPLYGQCRPHEDIGAIVRSYGRGEYPLDRFVARRFALDQYREAFRIVSDGTAVGKVVLVFDRSHR